MAARQRAPPSGSHLSQASTNREREGKWLDLQWEVADALARSRSIAQFGPCVLQALCSALEFQSAVLWKADGDALHRVSEWTAPAHGDDAGPRAGFAFPVVATTGTVGVVELLSSTPHERDERLDRLLAIIGRQLGEHVGRDRGELLSEAEHAAGAGSFELDLDSGTIGYSLGLRKIVALPPGWSSPSRCCSAVCTRRTAR